MNTKKAQLTEGNVEKVLITLTLPMILGMLGLVIFNLVDTYFVGKLGTAQLAALSFTFPVVLVVNSIALGLGIGSSSVISRAVGEGDYHKVQRLGTDSLLLAVLVVVVFCIIGILTIEPLFSLIGVDSETMPYVKEYMRIWYMGMAFVVVPMVGNNIIRALGDAKTPGIIMMIAAITNSILDPILIFGLGPFPHMGITGAAIATVFSRMTTFTVASYVLIKRDKVVILEPVKIKEILFSWKKILYVGVPNAITRMIMPVGAGIITKIMASIGIPAVAGFGVAVKIEFFSLAAIRALSSIMTPFVGQNYGAKKMDRVHSGIRFGEKISMLYGLIAFAILGLSALPIAKLFNGNPEVYTVTTTYLRIVPIVYGIQGVFLISMAALNAINKPFQAASLSLIQMFVLYVPMAILGGKHFGTIGVFGALVLSYSIMGIISHFLVKNMTRLPIK